VESRDLTRLLADVRFLGDAECLTARHPDADVTKRINASIRALRGMVTTRGAPYFLTSTTATTLAGTQVTGEVYSEVPYPPTATQIHGVDVDLAPNSGSWYSLEPISWVQRRDSASFCLGAPRYFTIRQLPAGSTNTVVAGTIDIFPAATAGNYKIWFLPEFVDLATGTDVFLGLPDWHDWVVWGVVRDLASRDDDQRETYAIAQQKQAEAEQRIFEGLGRVMSAGPLRPRRRGRGPWRI
jgi:hypothetical protein